MNPSNSHAPGNGTGENLICIPVFLYETLGYGLSHVIPELGALLSAYQIHDESDWAP